ncbi:MAG: hypothetical protein JSU70_07580, partial [Phycisphaerales bacterium]
PSAGLSLQLIESRKIWDQAPHNAFTDLILVQGKWYCALREGSGHGSNDGILRIIRSDDGVEWESVAGLAFQKPAGYDHADMREGNFSITPWDELLVNSAVALINDGSRIYQSLSYLSPDGTRWSEPYELTDPALNEWMWRTTWHDGYAYNFSYRCSPPYAIQLYRGTDGRAYAPFGPKYFEGNTYPNEHAFVFAEDDTCWCLLRRDGGSRTAQLGRAEPPYDNFQWQDLGVAIGGPEMIQMPNGRLIAAVRLYDGSTRTSICWVDHVSGSMTEMLTLPSGGDTGYAGMVLHDDILWVSYYSSHEGKTCIYLAKVRIVYCDTFNPMDFDMDCEVGFSDFAAFVAEWLECTRTDDPDCEQF